MIVVNEDDVLDICAKIRKTIKSYERYIQRLKKRDEDDWSPRKTTSWDYREKLISLMDEIGLDYNIATLAFFGHKKSLRYFKTGEADLFLIMHLNGEFK